MSMKRYIVQPRDTDVAGKPFRTYDVWDLVSYYVCSPHHATRAEARAKAKELNTSNRIAAEPNAFEVAQFDAHAARQYARKGSL